MECGWRTDCPSPDDLYSGQFVPNVLINALINNVILGSVSVLTDHRRTAILASFRVRFVVRIWQNSR